MPDKYTKEQIQEIHSIFANDETFSMLVNSFYSGATKKQQIEIHNLRANILNICNSLLATKDRSYDSPDLTKALTAFRSNALSDATSSKIKENEQAHLLKVAKNLITIVDNFSTKSFKYRSTDDFASSLVANADNATKLNFKKLTAYSALAKKYVATKSGKTYTYSKQESDAIAEVFKKEQIPEDDLKTICTELGNAYDNVCKVDFVQSTAKTNDLKHAGARLGQILLGTLGVIGFSLFLGSTGIGGMPTDGPTAEAVWGFIGSQVAPWAAAGFLTSGAVVGTQRGIAISRNKKIREQIKTKVKNKAKFFEILDKTRPENLQKEDRRENSVEKFVALLKEKNVIVNLEDTNFTTKTLANLLSSTQKKVSSAKTAEKKQKHLEAFKAELASKGIYLKGSKADNNEFLYDLLTRTQSTKSDGNEIDRAIDAFERALKANAADVFESKDFDFNLGLTKKERRANYVRMLDSLDRVKNDKKFMGAPLFSTARRKWLAKKTFNLPNQTTELEYKEKVSTNLSEKNPACEILRIKGAKPKKARTPRKDSSPAVKPTLTPNMTPAFARAEDTRTENKEPPRFTAEDDAHLQDVSDSIADPTIKEDALELDIAGAKFQIEIHKNNTRDHQKDLEMTMAKIKIKLSKMAVQGIKDKPTTLSLTDDDSLTVKITLKEKKGETPKK